MRWAAAAGLRKELALLAVTARKADFGLNLDEHIHRPRFIFFSSFSQAARMQIKLPVPTSASARTERGVGRSERASKSVPEGGARGRAGRGEPASPPSPCLVLPGEPRSGPLPRCPKPAGSGQQPHARAGGRARVSTRELLVPRWGPAGARFSRRGNTRSGPKFDSSAEAARMGPSLASREQNMENVCRMCAAGANPILTCLGNDSPVNYSHLPGSPLR